MSRPHSHRMLAALTVPLGTAAGVLLNAGSAAAAGPCSGGPAAMIGCARHPSRAVDAVVASAGSSVLGSVTGWFTGAAGWIVQQIHDFMATPTKPDLLGATWWVERYRLMLAFAVVVAAATLLLAIVEAAAKAHWGGLGQALWIDVPVAALVGGAGPILVQYLVDLADWLSNRLLVGLGVNLDSTLNNTGKWFLAFTARSSRSCCSAPTRST